MDIKVVMLGTSGSSPTKARSLPSVAMIYDGMSSSLTAERDTAADAKIRSQFIQAQGDIHKPCPWRPCHRDRGACKDAMHSTGELNLC
jgi:hypothetical protein